MKAPRWLRRLLARGRFDDAPQWSEKDAQNLQSFLGTETGKRFVGTLRALTVRAALVAVSRREGGNSLEWECGHASGIQDVASRIDALATVPDLVAKPDDDRPTDDLTWTHGNSDTDTGNDRRTG